jgi:cell division protein ZapA (FtsZ GTPase activity inhibitor)
MKVQISIGGRKYTLRSDEDEDLPAIARYVDRKMAEIGGRGARVDEYTLALLTALNIASEFDRYRREVDGELVSLDRDLASTALLLEAALPDEGGGEAPGDDLEALEP